MPYISKKISQKWPAFVFGNTYLHQTFTEYQYAHFGVPLCQILLQVMERPLILLRFLGIFIQNWQEFMFEVLYLHQTFTDCVSSWKTFWYMNILLVSLIQLRFWEFSYISTCVKRYNLIKLLQIICIGRSVEIESKSV